MNFPILLGSEHQRRIEMLRLQPEFAAFAGLPASLPSDAFKIPSLLPFYLRQALEHRWLVGHGVPAGRAALAASRAAAQFFMPEIAELSVADRAALPSWLPRMAADLPPPPSFLASLAPQADAADIAKIIAVWALLNTAEALMETGGDIRLERDPRSALNGYGCSHRPRPWAVTFASSTASSSSERGYAAADARRLRTTAALLSSARRPAIAQTLTAARDGIAAIYGLGEGCEIILAASGTDTELLALALTHLAAPGARVKNILIAPEETGRGVPMAARGLHFAVDTALGAAVTFEAPISGFRPDTALASIALRTISGALRPAGQVESAIDAEIAAGIAAGERVILHALDLSKTGLLAPGPAFLRRMRQIYGTENLDIVVDACQARLSPASVRDYLALGAVVLVTGSKFFTGPPFAGAALLPPAIAARLKSGALPAGLDAYFGRDEFPESCPAAERLPPQGNYGLALRWHAALAEMQAFMRVPLAGRAQILADFGAAVRAKIAENPALQLLPQPPIHRAATDEPWERLPSIFTFSVRAPHEDRCLTLAEARAVYLWLNADLSAVIPGQNAAARICHIGQPVKLPQPGGAGAQGVLRVSAGARLISGEPSHQGLGGQARIARELADLATVFDKIDLILRNWNALCAADPAPCYRPPQ
jgi:hypothetical protein